MADKLLICFVNEKIGKGVEARLLETGWKNDIVVTIFENALRVLAENEFSHAIIQLGFYHTLNGKYTGLAIADEVVKTGTPKENILITTADPRNISSAGKQYKVVEFGLPAINDFLNRVE